MAYKNFINDFNKDLTGDVLCFYGAEDFLMDWAVEQVINKYVDESARELDVQMIDGETIQAAEIIGAARAFSMFSDKRVIIIRNYLPMYRKSSDVDGDALLEFCSQKQDSSIVIFRLESKYTDDLTAYGKKLVKAASSYDFATLERADLKAFINKRIHAAGKLIGHREMDYLIDLSGYYNKNSEYHLNNFDSDLEKITNACEGDQISVSLIEELLIGKEDKYVFNLVDAIMTGNKTKAMELAETIITEDDGAVPVLGLLTKQFEIMYDSLELSKEGLSISQIAKQTGVNEYRLKKAYQAARKLNIDRIREMLVRAYNIERDFKTGNMDKDVAFEMLLISI